MDSFEQRKKDILKKEDKSSKGSWDLKVKDLCEKINSNLNYYTTSSCSGKCVLLEERTGKNGSYYLWTSHESIIFEELFLAIDNIGSKNVVKFKSESPIIFVVCRDIDFAKKLLKEAVSSGFKESGIKITEKLIGVEIRSGEKLEFPLMKEGNLLVSNDFLNEIINQSNSRRKIGWEKIEKLILNLS